MKKKYNLAALVSLLIFILMLALVKLSYIGYFDNKVYSLFHINDFNTMFMTIITFFGEPETIFYITILILLFLENKKEKMLIIINTILGLNIYYLLKIIIKRPRPIGINLVDATGYSFPSGHTFMTFVFYGFIIYLINLDNSKYLYKSVLNILLILLIILMPISRIYLGVHFASDTIAGFSLAITYLFVFINVIKKQKLL